MFVLSIHNNISGAYVWCWNILHRDKFSKLCFFGRAETRTKKEIVVIKMKAHIKQ